MTKPTNTEFREIFDSAAKNFDTISSAYAVSRRCEFFLAKAKGDCLEVGAGTGEISKALGAHGHRVVATDISPKMVEEIKKKGIETVVSDAEYLPFPDASFDTIVGAEMIYYLDHPENFIKESYRILKPGGEFLLSSANSRARFYDYLRTFLRLLGFGGMYFDDPNREFMTEKKLRALLKGGGFQIKEMKTIMPLPAGFFDILNRLLEKTPLRYFGIFILMQAKKL